MTKLTLSVGLNDSNDQIDTFLSLLSERGNFFRIKSSSSFLRSNADVVTSNCEVDVHDELGSSSKVPPWIPTPQLVPEVSPRWPQVCSL